QLILRCCGQQRVWFVGLVRVNEARLSGTHVVIVRMAHLEPSVPFWDAAGVAFASDVLEGIAAFPLAAIPSTVTFHRITPSEVVPGSNQVYSFNRRGCSPTGCVLVCLGNAEAM